MGSSSRFHEIFAAEPLAAAGVPFARFMELALYHPEAGYYARRRQRIGREAQSDFYTATSLGPLFGELVVAAAVKLLAPLDPGDFTFVEIGAEPLDVARDRPLDVARDRPLDVARDRPLDVARDGPLVSTTRRPVAGGVLRNVAHPFAGSATISLGQPIELPVRCVVFSNELFDAQPCHRLVHRRGAWRELGVALRGDALVEVELPALTSETAAISAQLPAEAPDGYHLDLPLQAVELLRQITAQPWRGLFLAFDYGKSWLELSTETPQGTARAYAQHRQKGDLLAQPGEQDLTCHVCWDWLGDTLAGEGFGAARVESQEAFFTHHAAAALQTAIAAEAAHFSPRKQALLQLLHPAQMGQKFQALHALRK
jgi:SAM-dependent MidA family methyltransferase